MALFNRFVSEVRRCLGMYPETNSGVVLEDEAEALIAQGNKQEDNGSLLEAKELYQRAERAAPTLSKVHLNLGNVLLALGQPEDAIQAYTTAIFHQPDCAAAYFNIGNAELACKRPSNASKAYDKAFVLSPDLADAGKLHNFGLAFKALDRLNDAVKCFTKAVALKPDFCEAHCDLANAYRELGDSTNAIKAARVALSIDPNASGAWSLLLFCLSHSQDTDAQSLFAAHRRFGEQFEPQCHSLRIDHQNSREPDRVLNVGFVSPDLRSHVVASFFEPVFRLLVKMPSLSVHIYDNGGEQDDVSLRMRAIADHWVEVAGLEDAQLADLIRVTKIDILIDLTGHTPRHRLLTFARKPAPIQMSWIGYPGTTGMQSIDYYVGDKYFLPWGEFDDLFTEKILRIPANAAFQSAVNSPSVKDLPALKNGFVTFASFNRVDKISKDVVALWSRLMTALPGSKLLLGGLPVLGDFDQLIEWFAHEGVGAERLLFYRRCSMDVYLQLHHQVDICLDTFPYGGGTTTCHAIWMGVPTLTLAGATVASRGGQSIMSHVGLQDTFCAKDPQEFVSKGKWCATNLNYLQELRLHLRERFQNCALSQPSIVASGFEFALRNAWSKWCAGLPAATFEVINQNGSFSILENPKKNSKNTV